MRNIILLSLVAVATSCSSGSNREAAAHEFTVAGDTITLAAGSPVADKLKVETAVKSPYKSEFTTSGVVRAIPTNYAEIAAPFAGRITKSYVRLGQKVAPGSPVFEISSPAFFETAKAYFQTRQEMELARKNLKRERDLLQNNVGVAKDTEEAEVAYEIKKQDYENARAALNVFQIDPDKITLGQPLVVRSPIAGEVVANNIVIGQYFKEDAAPLAVVADLNRVWVAARVKEKDLHLIEQLDDVSVRLAAMPDRVQKGSVYHISELLDEATRSVEVLIECDNRDRTMKPNMYGTVQLTDSAVDAFLIPSQAVLQQEQSCYVLVSMGGDRYRKTEVTVGNTTNGKTVILSGLNAGDGVVTDGAFYLINAK